MNIDFEQLVLEKNNMSLEEFESYSPFEMNLLLYHTFTDKRSPLTLHTISDQDKKEIPFFQFIKYLLNILKEEKEIKLTKIGNFPPKYVKELYEQKFILQEDIESGITKLTNQQDYYFFEMAVIICHLLKWIKKRNNCMSLTKKGEKILKHEDNMLKDLFILFFSKFNWGYFDGYDDEPEIQNTSVFFLICLSKYGQTERPISFYTDKIFGAFPHLSDKPFPDFIPTFKIYYSKLYNIRFFRLFLKTMGLIYYRRERDREFFSEKIFIKKTPVFDKLLGIIPHVDYSQINIS